MDLQCLLISTNTYKHQFLRRHRLAARKAYQNIYTTIEYTNYAINNNNKNKNKKL